MRIVSPLLKELVYPSLSKLGLFRAAAPGGLAIITYHGVLPEGYESIDSTLDGNLVTAKQFRQQLRLLKAHYNVISPEQCLQWCRGEYILPDRAVLLTCDDGLLNCLTDMLPVMQEENVRCLFFVTGASAEESRAVLWYEELLMLFLRVPEGSLATSVEGVKIHTDSPKARIASWWTLVQQLSRLDPSTRACFLSQARTRLGQDLLSSLAASPVLCRRFGLMTVAECRALASSGMTIGAHTLTHPVLAHVISDIAYSEIAQSRVRLEAALGLPVWAFAYPFGDSQSVTPAVLDMPRAAGFTAAFLNVCGGFGVNLPRFALPRVHVTKTMSNGEFEAHVCGFYAWLQRTARRDVAGGQLETS